jgi:FlaA1/EpsC-like NDP-sugar epimerase
MKKFLYRNFVFILVADILLVAFAWYFAYLLRFNFEIPVTHSGLLTRFLPLIVLIKIVTFYFFDLYRGMWRYTSITDFFDIIKAASVSALLVVVVILYTHRFVGFARSILIIDWGLTVFLISGLRLGIRIYFWLSSEDETVRLNLKRFFKIGLGRASEAKRLLIIGAGDAGEKIFREIQNNPKLRYKVIGFLDDDTQKVGMQLHGVPILGTIPEIISMASKMKAEEILIASPSATGRQMRRIVSKCEETGIPFKTVPGMGELINGKVTVKTIRDVSYEDLLGREVIHLDENRIGGYLENARVLVTGAGGSIGAELCRQICRFTPASVFFLSGRKALCTSFIRNSRRVFPRSKLFLYWQTSGIVPSLLTPFQNIGPR